MSFPDGTPAQSHPHLQFHPKNGQLLVTSSLGQAMVWNFSLEAAEETPTVVNLEQVFNEEHSGRAVEQVISSTTSVLPDAELALKKARLLDQAIHAECRGVVTTLPLRMTYAKHVLRPFWSRHSNRINTATRAGGPPTATMSSRTARTRNP